MLFGAADAPAALEAAEETGLLVVMTKGAQGAVVLTAHGPEAVPAAPVDQVVDTTGAGDLFAAGLPVRATHGWTRSTARGSGGLCAAEVISHTGARPEADLRALAAAAGLLVRGPATCPSPSASSDCPMSASPRCSTR